METTIKVSDHAIVRYLERIMGFDIELIRNAIATPGIKKQTDILGNGEFITGKCRVVVVNNTAVTVKNLDMI